MNLLDPSPQPFPTGALPATPVCFEPETLETVSSPTGKIFLLCLYTSTSLLSLVGNLVVIVVQLYGQESSRNIRKYLLNLAVADIITGVFSVPLTYTNITMGHWIFPHWLCPAAYYVQLVSVFVTTMTLTIISIER